MPVSKSLGDRRDGQLRRQYLGELQAGQGSSRDRWQNVLPHHLLQRSTELLGCFDTAQSDSEVVRPLGVISDVREGGYQGRVGTSTGPRSPMNIVPLTENYEPSR